MTETTEPTIPTEKKTWRHRLQHIRLSIILAFIIMIAGLVVAVAYGAYWRDDNRKYDIARPGSQVDNTILDVEEDTGNRTNPVSPEDAKRKVSDFAKEIKTVDGMNRFEAGNFTDQAIKLIPSDQPSL